MKNHTCKVLLQYLQKLLILVVLFKVYFIDYVLQLSHFFSPLYPPALYLILFSMSLGHTYKFFGFSISYSILNLPPILYHQLCFLFLVPFLPFSPFSFPTDNPPCDLQFCDSVPVLVVYVVFIFDFQAHLLIVGRLLSFYCSYF